MSDAATDGGGTPPRIRRMSLFALAVFVLVTCGMLWPLDVAHGTGIPHMDKVVHVAAWLVLALVTWAPLSYLLQTHTRWSSRAARAAVAIGALGLWGITTELLQGLVPNRAPDAWDALADVTGAALGAALMVFFEAARDPAPTTPPTETTR